VANGACCQFLLLSVPVPSRWIRTAAARNVAVRASSHSAYRASSSISPRMRIGALCDRFECLSVSSRETDGERGRVKAEGRPPVSRSGHTGAAASVAVQAAALVDWSSSRNMADREQDMVASKAVAYYDETQFDPSSAEAQRRSPVQNVKGIPGCSGRDAAVRFCSRRGYRSQQEPLANDLTFQRRLARSRMADAQSVFLRH
jgi:hypothetical protein